jgi:hypothetical protein
MCRNCHNRGGEGLDLDNMSSGEIEIMGVAQPQEGWEVESGNKRKTKKKLLLQATRQSSRLKCHGGMHVEEMAAKRKQRQNLDPPGNKHSNPFTVLNNLDDRMLLQTAKDLDIQLGSDEDKGLAQIDAIKAEERLRAAVAETSYKIHLEKLKLRESIHDNDCLDLTIIDNTQRGVSETLVPNQEINGKKGGRGEVGKRKNKIHVLEC